MRKYQKHSDKIYEQDKDALNITVYFEVKALANTI